MFVSALPDPTSNSEISANGGNKQILYCIVLYFIVPPWYSSIEPKPVYESADAQAFWDVPLYADHVVVRTNRIDARVVDHKRKIVTILEMSCPWVDNRAAKDQDKTEKYASLRLELKQQFKDTA